MAGLVPANAVLFASVDLDVASSPPTTDTSGNFYSIRTASGECGGASSVVSRGRERRRMAWAFGIAAAYMVAEVVGGFISNSLALLADAGHMATDVAALGISLWAMRLAERPPRGRHSYGYQRAEILAALLNGAILVAITFYILYEAYRRVREPPEVVGGVMLAVAAGGLAVNLIAAWLLKDARHASLNVRGAWLHVLGDALGSLGAILGALLILGFGWRWADPLAGGLIGLLILYSSWTLLRDSVEVLMAAAPEDVDMDEIRRRFLDVNGVEAVHDLHVWTLTSGFTILTAHVDVRVGVDRNRVLAALDAIARRDFGIDHPTVQLEDVGAGVRAASSPMSCSPRHDEVT